MIYKFKIVSDEVERFFREIEIDSEANFLQLRNAILDSVNYTRDDLSSFFICDDDWTMRKEITLSDMGSDSDEDVWLMEDTRIDELVEDEGQHLMFVFDYLTERCFYMELKEIITGKTLRDPLCTRKEGKAPAQKMSSLDFEEMVNKSSKKGNSKLEDDLDISFYGESAYNEDELSEGFDSIDEMN
jgi:hypothetical protein